jgi:tripartite-type tricarboxylate transporter receptor subunit TctC
MPLFDGKRNMTNRRLARFARSASVAIAAAALFAAALPAAVGQDQCPSKPIRMIVPFPEGSPPDLIARMLAEPLGAARTREVIIENKPGAGGIVGTRLIAKAAREDCTIGLSLPGPLLLKAMEYDPFNQLAPITVVAARPSVLVVDPKLGVASVADFVKLARSQPGKLNYGSVGNGSPSHLTMELLKQRTGIDLTHMPYPGSREVGAAILNGQIAAGFVDAATAMPLVEAGRLTALGATTRTRSVVLPEMPTIAEQGFAGFESTEWIGAVAPAGTPHRILDQLSTDLRQIIRNNEGVRQRMMELYFQPEGTTPWELRNLMRRDADRWGNVIKAASAIESDASASIYQFGRFTEALARIAWPLVVFFAILFYGRSLLNRLISAVRKVKGAGVEVEFGHEKALEVRESFHESYADTKQAMRDLYGLRAEAFHLDQLLVSAATAIGQQIERIVGKPIKGKWRATVHVEDVVFKGYLYQLLDYHPKGTGHDRRFSERYGIIGRAWRLGKSIGVANVPQVTEGDSREKAIDALVSDWGMTRSEAEKWSQAPTSHLCIVLRTRSRGLPVGILYADSEERDAFGTDEQVREAAKQLQTDKAVRNLARAVSQALEKPRSGGTFLDLEQ